MIAEQYLREAIMRVKGIAIVGKQELQDLQQIIEILPEITGDFPITSVCRDDLEGLGFDVSNVSDEDMKTLASKMADDYGDQLRDISMSIIASMYLNIPKKPKFRNENIEELRVAIQTAWDKHVLKFGHEPLYLACSVRYREDDNSAAAIIKLNEELDDKDDQIFYYCHGLNDVFSFLDYGAEDFIITDATEFLDEI